MKRFRQSPTGDGFVQNPYPFHERARQAGDIIWWEDCAMPCATTWRAVNAILPVRRFGREIPADKRTAPAVHLAPFYAIEAHSMLEPEDPRHTQRGLRRRGPFLHRRADGPAGTGDRAADPL